jgi:hypothetical protein
MLNAQWLMSGQSIVATFDEPLLFIEHCPLSIAH